MPVRRVCGSSLGKDQPPLPPPGNGQSPADDIPDEIKLLVLDDVSGVLINHRVDQQIKWDRATDPRRPADTAPPALSNKSWLVGWTERCWPV